MANYLILNQAGDWSIYNVNSYTNALVGSGKIDGYIKSKVKYASTNFPLSEDAWRKIFITKDDKGKDTEIPWSSESKTNLFNSLCTSKALQIKASILDFTELYPTPATLPDATKRFFLITEAGKCMCITKTSANAIQNVRDLLRYYTEVYVSDSNFKVAKAIWDNNENSVLSAIALAEEAGSLDNATANQLMVEYFNSLVISNTLKIAFVGALTGNNNNLYPNSAEEDFDLF